MTVTRDSFLAAIDRVAVAMERDFDMLNTADGALGDGDLGVTMTRGMRAIIVMKDDLPDDIGMTLFQCAQAFTKSSGSSYGTLMATGLMSAAKTIRGQQSISKADIPALVAGARGRGFRRRAQLAPRFGRGLLHLVAVADQKVHLVVVVAGDEVEHC